MELNRQTNRWTQVETEKKITKYIQERKTYTIRTDSSRSNIIPNQTKK